MAVVLGPDVVWDAMAECIDAEAGPPEAVDGVPAAQGLQVGGIFAQVAKQLQASGVGFLAVMQWFMIIVKLIREYGPQVAEIVRKILDAIREGKTPETFFAAAEAGGEEAAEKKGHKGKK